MEKLIHSADGKLVVDDPTLVVGNKFKTRDGYPDEPGTTYIVTQRCADYIQKWRAVHPSYIEARGQMAVVVDTGDQLTQERSPRRFWTKDVELIKE